MTRWPTQTAIHAATHSNSARDAERRARYEAVCSATHCVALLLLIPVHRRRFPLPAFMSNYDAKARAAHEAIGA